MLADMPYTILRDAIFTHLTMNEGLTMLFARPPALAKSNLQASVSRHSFSSHFQLRKFQEKLFVALAMMLD